MVSLFFDDDGPFGDLYRADDPVAQFLEAIRGLERVRQVWAARFREWHLMEML